MSKPVLVSTPYMNKPKLYYKWGRWRCRFPIWHHFVTYTGPLYDNCLLASQWCARQNKEVTTHERSR